MPIAVTFRQMETSQPLREYATEKLEHILQKYLRKEADATVVLSVERFWHIADITLQVRGQRIKSQERSEDMYASIDLALGRLERQLRRYKDKLNDRYTKPSPAPEAEPAGAMTFSHLVVTEADAEEEMDVDLTGLELDAMSLDELPDPEEYGFIPVELKGSSDGSPGHHVKVLRSNRYSVSPMTVADAIMQLNLQDMQFLVFTRAETSQINVIYRRRDGSYGIIET
ncbi:MAG: ribosomal subunit interface protein [Myxococcales bacterium]|nr:ribosomal subunit interface protein [Myxococcales bacterium]